MRENALIGLISLGCPKNLVDGECMLGLLVSQGYAITGDAGQADVIIVNTCGFIDAAKKESIGAILDMAEKKRTGRCRALIVTGCLSERYCDAFKTELPEVDAVLGAGEYGRICEVVENLLTYKKYAPENPAEYSLESPSGVFSYNEPRSVHECTPEQRLGHLNAARVLTGSPGCVYIKIAEGCDNNCAYCVIPSIRGAYASRRPDEILAEAARFSADREIEAVLIAQDVTRYGTAGGWTDTAPLCGLIEALSEIERVKWIRLMYAFPDRVDDRLIDLLAGGGKLLRYIDMPVQHASDAVLKRMGRRRGRAELNEIIAELRRRVPGVVIRTTLMTGFPGETERDFSELLDFIGLNKFERLGVFAYSREEGTPAALMDGQTPKKTAQKRRAALLRVQSQIMSRSEAGRIGQTYEAIVDSVPARGARAGAPYRVRTYAEAPEIDGYIRVAGALADSAQAAERGRFVNIRITGRDAKGLYGVLLP